MNEPVITTDIAITGLRLFALCGDGKTRAVSIPTRKGPKLYHFLKENISAGVIRLSTETYELPGVTPTNQPNTPETNDHE